MVRVTSYAEMAERLEDPLDIEDAKDDNLGGLELLELGDAKKQELFRHARLGFTIPPWGAYFIGFAVEALPQFSGLLSDLLAVPLDFIETGVDTVIDSFASLVAQLPIIGELAAAVLLATKVIADAVLELPEQVLKFTGNLGVAWKTLSPEARKAFLAIATQLLIDAAPPEQKPIVAQKLAVANTEPLVAGGFPYGEVAVTALNGLAVGAFFVL